MNRSARTILAAAVASGLAGLTSAALLTGPTAAAPAPVPAPAGDVAGPGLCLDLSAVGLPSVCAGPIL